MTKKTHRLPTRVAVAAFITCGAIVMLGSVPSGIAGTISAERPGGCANPGGACTSSINGTYAPRIQQIRAGA